MAQQTARDQGGIYQALSGFLGKYGLETKTTTTTLGAAGSVYVEANPKRIWALIHNADSANTIVIYFGSEKTAGHTIASGGIMQIDRFMPWSGAMSIYSASGADIVVTEASVV